MMEVFLLADAHHRIGTGHVTRCLWLAEAIRERRGRACFLLRESARFARERVEAEGFPVLLVPDEQLDDAGTLLDQVKRRAEMANPWMLTDGDEAGWYELDFQRAIRSAGVRLMMIVFPIEGRFEVDILHNQNPRSLDHTYELLPDTRLLAGLEYLILAPVFRNSSWKPPEKAIRTVFVNFGGADPQDQTIRVCRLLNDRFPQWTQIVVVGGLYNHRAALEKTLKAKTEGPPSRLYQNTPAMAELMREADLAITAGGLTAWELGILGVPNVVLPGSERERLTADYLAERGKIFFPGPAREVTEDDLCRLLALLEKEPERRQRQSRGLFELLNPQGIERVVDALFEMHSPN
jgi:UDP-2,4-diacetamido-2,4,6-trideoxy-beta-L-altropyranose hydrolase